jgi:alpha-ribazole phosphatase
MSDVLALWMWRHPRPVGAAGRCIGRTDLAVDSRRAKRLAHRIVAVARRERLPRVVWTSPAQRCAEVGRHLRRAGFVHRIDERLWELDFGAWDGIPWADIGWGEVEQWEAGFAHHRPGGGESLAMLIERARGFLAERASSGGGPVLIVGHAGWMAATGLAPGETPCATRWPRAIAYGSMTRCLIEMRNPGD